MAAYNTFGNLSDQSVLVMTTPSPTTPTVVLPLAPTNLTASPVSSSQIHLAFTAATGGVDIAGYNVYENGAEIATATDTYYVVMSLTAGTYYSFTVAAYHVSGDVSAQSASAGATTQSAGETVTPVMATPTVPVPVTTSPTLAPGCLSTYGFSTTTGQSCIPNPRNNLFGWNGNFYFHSYTQERFVRQ